VLLVLTASAFAESEGRADTSQALLRLAGARPVDRTGLLPDSFACAVLDHKLDGLGTTGDVRATIVALRLHRIGTDARALAQHHAVWIAQRKVGGGETQWWSHVSRHFSDGFGWAYDEERAREALAAAAADDDLELQRIL